MATNPLLAYIQNAAGQLAQGFQSGQNAQPTPQGASLSNILGNALGAPIDPASDAISAGGQIAGHALPFLAAGINTADKAISALPKVVRVVLKPGVYGAGREAAVQKTVDSIVPGATATEKYNNLQPTMNNLGDQITNIMAQDPKAAPLQQVLSDYDKNLQDQGVYRTSSASKDQVQKIANGYINDLHNEASGGNAVLNPSEIQDTSLQKIKQQVNQDSQSIYKKIDNGTSLNDKDKVILAARQTLDDTLTTLHPEIKDLTTQQSHLYDAADSLFKGREGEIKDTSATPNTFLGNLKQGVINHPIGSIATGASLLSGAGLLGYTAKVAASQPKNYQFSSGNVNLPALNDISDSNGNSLGDQNVSNYLDKLSSINDQEKGLALSNRLHLPGADAKLSQLETDKQTLAAQNVKIAPVINQYLETQNALSGLQAAQGLIKNANPQWFQAYGPVGSQLTGIRSALVPGYSSFIQQLNSLSGSGINTSAIANAASPQAADAAIQTAVKYYQNKLNNTLSTSGYRLPSSQITGKDILNTQLNNANNPPQAAPSTAQASPSPQQASPTPDKFQQLLQAGYQQGIN